MKTNPIDIEWPQGPLKGVLHQPDARPRFGVVICHGMLSYKDSPKHVGIATRLCQKGFAALRFDFWGRGESGGDLLSLTFSSQVEQCRCAIKALRQQTGIEGVALVGSSMGGATAILTAATQEVLGLATLAAVGRTELLAQRVVGHKSMDVWKRKGFLHLEGQQVGWSLVEDSRQVDVPQAASRVDCPWLLVHGQEDEVVPVSDAHELHQAAAGSQLMVVEQADHRFSNPEHLDLIQHSVVTFLDRVLKNR